MNNGVEPSQPLSIKEIALHLADSNKPLRNTELAELSDLNLEELAELRQVWMATPPRRRQQIADRLVELAEDNFELNFDAIFKSLLTDEDAEVRIIAINGLWENEDTTLIPPFIKMVEQDDSVKVQAAAAAALGKFAMLAECGKLRPIYTERISKTLLSATRDEKRPVEVRHWALEAVAPLSLPQVREAITATYQSGDAKLRISAIYAMGKNCDTRWLLSLTKELSSTDSETRYEAASALGELGEEEAVPHLAQLLSDEESDVRLAAIRALEQIGGTLARNYLKRCLASPNEADRQMAEAALEEIDAGKGMLGFRP